MKEVKSTNENPALLFEGMDVKPILNLYFQIAHLKQMYRQGWLQEGRDVPEEKCEKVSGHSLGVVILALFLAVEHFPKLNLEKVLCMAAIHDLPEAHPKVGDITPRDGVSKEEKHQREKEAMIGFVSGFSMGEKILALWREYEANETPEAQFVNQLDKLEMGLQALIYRKQGYGKDLVNMLKYSADRVIISEMVEIIEDAGSLLGE